MRLSYKYQRKYKDSIIVSICVHKYARINNNFFVYYAVYIVYDMTLLSKKN